MKTNPMYRYLKVAPIVLYLLSPFFARSATFSSNPIADAFVTTGPSGNLVNNNYGGAGALSFAAPGLAQGEFQSLMQFGLAGAKSAFDSQFGIGQWSVQSVTLQLTAASPNNGIFNATAAGQFQVSLMQNNSWTEGTGTPQAPGGSGITFSTLNNFLNPSDEALGTFSFGGATSGSASYNLNLTPSLFADVLAGGTVSLRTFAAVDSSVSYLFDSRSFGTASSRPLLIIDAVPEPTSTAISLAGLFLFACSRFALRGLGTAWRHSCAGCSSRDTAGLET